MTNTYQQILREFKDKISAHTSDYIPRMYKALINEGRSPGDARQKLEEDLLDYISENTLLRNLKEEAKDKAHVKGAETRAANKAVTNMVTEQEETEEVSSDGTVTVKKAGREHHTHIKRLTWCQPNPRLFGFY